MNLVLAIPSKGRLMEAAHDLFDAAGLAFARDNGGRGYRARIAGLDGVEVRLLSASEIAAQLSAGGVHLGITGEDLIRESVPDADDAVHFVAPLGFGHADVVVASPKAWIDVTTMADLEDVAARMHAADGHRLRVATKYVTLTRAFFAAHGVRDYRIVESLGATEGAPAAGTAEVVVDITSSGATLDANGLGVLADGLILASQANLVASLRADWNDAACARVRDILSRLAAHEMAHRTVELRASVSDAETLSKSLQAQFGVQLPFGIGDPLVLHTGKAEAYAVASALRAKASGAVTMARLEAIFAPQVPTLDGLLARIDAGDESS